MKPPRWPTGRASLAPALLAGTLTLSAWAVAAGSAESSYRVHGDGIPATLTAEPGDPGRGRTAVLDAGQGNCLVCHRIPGAEARAHGTLGPPLDQVGLRLTPAQLRLRLVDARRLNPRSVMPAFHKTGGLHRVAAAYRGKPLLDAQAIEDVVAYLWTLQ